MSIESSPKLARLFAKVVDAKTALESAEANLQSALQTAVANHRIPDGTSKAEIARRMNIKPPYLQDLMNGRRNWSMWLATAYERAVKGEKVVQ